MFGVRYGQPLNDREYETLARLGRGATIKEAAWEMSYSPATLKWYCKTAYIKLGVNSLLQAMLALGWLVIPETAPGPTPDVWTADIHYRK